jgi:hypothetical protein
MVFERLRLAEIEENGELQLASELEEQRAESFASVQEKGENRYKGSQTNARV